jgi:hypothetical protein
MTSSTRLCAPVRPPAAGFLPHRHRTTNDTQRNAFLDIRSADLRNPANSASVAEWRQTIDRIECVRRIARTGNTGLDRPITFFVYGGKYTIP